MTQYLFFHSELRRCWVVFLFGLGSHHIRNLYKKKIDFMSGFLLPKKILIL